MSMSSNTTENLIVLNCSFFFFALFTSSKITTFADIHICIFPSLVNTFPAKKVLI